MVTLKAFKEIWKRVAAEAGVGGLRCSECGGQSSNRTYYPDPRDVTKLLGVACYQKVIRELTK